jgi:predicted ATPase/DNA-binding XRE family transcriptional regulator
MSFGQRLRGLRRDFDLSQTELGSRAGCSVNTVRKLEADERKPSRELAARLADVFDLTTRDRADFMRLARGARLGARRVLPMPMTRLVGREADLAALRERLLSADVRLLTLVGPPGVGKTRLALRVATDLQDSFRDGAAFVQLAAVREPGLVLDSVAQALGVRLVAARPTSEVLIEQLAQEHLLLVLDNFEQVLSAREELPPLLAAVPRLKVVVTSREPLGLYGEHLYSVPTLSVPSMAERRGRSASETLFLERARAIRFDFGTRPGDEAHIADICERLEGLPLAIELAASRARTINPRPMRDELRHRLDLLSVGPTDFTPRQRSMRGALDWSYALLTPSERHLFGQLSVFAGGGAVQAVSAVCGAGASALHSLADKSLVTFSELGGSERFQMLEVIREYALEQWCRDAAAAAQSSLHEQHAAYYASLAEGAPAGLRGHQQLAWLERLDADHDNLRAALGWSVAHGPVRIAGQLGAGLWPFWRARGLYREGRRWLQQLLPLADGMPVAIRANVLNGAGVLALLQTDYVAAQSHLEAACAAFVEAGDLFGQAFATSNLGWLARNREDSGLAQRLFTASLQVRRDIGDRWGEAWTLNNLGVVALDRSDMPAARALLSESVELFGEVGDRFGSLQALHNLAWVLRELGDYPQARTLYAQSLKLARMLDDARGVANSLGDLALMSLYTGDYVTASEMFEDSLNAYARLGDQRNVAGCIEGLAGVAAVTGKALDAARLFGLSAAMRERVGAPLLATDRTRYESTLASAREQLAAAQWQRAWAEGRASTPARLLPDLFA